MKSDELFEMLGDIDDKFVDAALPEEGKVNAVQSQEIRMNKRRFPRIITAAAAVVAVCAVLGTVIAVNLNKGTGWTLPADSTATVDEVTEIYTYDSSSDSMQTITFTMYEFGEDVLFTIDEKQITRKDKNGDTTQLIGFPQIGRVCLGDINGDGKREIVASGWNGLSGLSADYIQAYDLENSKRYTLSMEQYCHGFGSCGIEIKDDIIYARLTWNSQTGDGDIKPLALDMMFEVNESYKPEVEVVLDEGVNNIYDFTMPEYPEYQFIIENGGITVKNTETGESKRLLNTVEIKKICLYDECLTYQRDIYAVARLSGGQNTVICHVYFDNSVNDFGISYYEPLESGYDVDIEIQDGRPMITDSSPIDTGFSESAESDKAVLTVSSACVKHSILQSGISILASLENKTNDTIYLYSSEPSDAAYSFIHTSLSCDGKALSLDENCNNVWINEKVNYYPISPGSTVDVDISFSLENAEIGIYDGICSVDVTDSPNDNSPRVGISVKFQLEIKGESTSEPTSESTPEPTSESTPEPTSESTPEPTSESTSEPTSETSQPSGGVYRAFDELSMNVYTDNSGNLISVTAEIENTANNSIYLYSSHRGDIVHVNIRNGGSPLMNTQMFYEDSIEVVEIKPGDTYTQTQTFTRYTGYDDFTREPAAPGEYQGTATVTVMSDPNDFTIDSMTYRTVEFTVTV